MTNHTAILNIVSYHCNVSVGDMLSHTRTSDIIEAKQLAQYIIRLKNPKRNVKKRTGVSDSEIANIFEQSRCTMIHSFKTVRNLADTDKKYRERLEVLLEACKGVDEDKSVVESLVSYTKDQIYRIVANFALTVNTESFCCGNGTTTEIVKELKKYNYVDFSGEEKSY